MKGKVKATVGLCVKNEEKNIKEVVESIVSQDFPYELMELIVVDGYSKDRTLRIIKRSILNKEICVKIFHENEGLGAARQIVVDNAHGDYIVWVDCDMTLPKDYIRKHVEFMENNPTVGIAKGRFGIVPGTKLVAFLENIAFAASFFHCAGKPIFRLLGTEGSVYRVAAIREVGGFDGNIKGAGEDIDAAYRIRAAGWLFYVTHGIFYEKSVKTWKQLWRQYFWYGYGGHYLFHKDSRINPAYEMLPPTAFLVGLWRSFAAYSLTLRKAVFLLPLHYVFKRIAWCFGFLKAHLDGYEPVKTCGEGETAREQTWASILSSCYGIY